MWCPTKKLGPIDSAVLTFIGYKQTDRHPNRQAKLKYRYRNPLTLISLYKMKYNSIKEPFNLVKFVYVEV